MAMRSVVSFSGLRRLTKGANVALRSSVTGLRHFSDGKILGEEERAQENIYIQVFMIFLIFFFIFVLYFWNLCSNYCCLIIFEWIVIEYSEIDLSFVGSKIS